MSARKGTGATAVVGVVFQVSSADDEVYRAVLHQISNLLGELPEAIVEVVVHSRGLPFFTSGADWQPAVDRLQQRGVRFLLCAHSLAAAEASARRRLRTPVETVPSAVAHLVKRQSEGWAYLKAGF